MFKKIIFPTDNSEVSGKALNYVIKIAKKHNSEVLIFFALPKIEPILGDLFLAHKPEYNSEIDNLFSVDWIFKEIKHKFEKNHIKTKVLLHRGDPGEEIIKLIDSENIDLIIMGSENLNENKNTLIESTADYVNHHTKCPILLIH